MVHIYVDQFKDTTIYTIDYMVSAFGINTTPATFFTKINESVVAISFRKIKGISLPEDVSWQYIKDIFPIEYSHYKKYGDYPPPPTARDLLWILTFKGEKLVKFEKLGP